MFCSEEQFEQALQQAREEAAYDACLGYMLARAEDDFAKGRRYGDLAALKTAVARERGSSRD